jgi:hypothetical protein
MSIQVTDEQLTAEMKKMAKKRVIDEMKARKLAEEKKAIRDKKIKAEKAKIEKERKAREKYLEDLPKIFKTKLDNSILKAMEKFDKIGGLQHLDRLYKMAVIRKEIVGDIK